MLFAEPSEFFFTAGYDSPVGHLDLAMSERGLAAVAFHGRWVAPHGTKNVRWIEEPDRFRDVIRQLDEYFAGARRSFDLPLDLRGPAFHQLCWQALLRIPYGQTWSYAQLAAAVGSPLGVACRRPGEPPQSGRDHRSLPPRHRLQRHPCRIRRWPCGQGIPAQS